MVYTYYEVGRIIVEDEQQGEQRAEYGTELLKHLSEQLSNKFGKGFSVQNLANMRQFYLTYSKDEIFQTVYRESEVGFTLSWSHYLKLMVISPDTHHLCFFDISGIFYLLNPK